MQVKAEVLHPIQHDRFYVQGETVDMPQHIFDELSAVGLVRQATAETVAPARKAKPKAP